MNKRSFILHQDSLDILDALTKEQIADLFLAIRDFNRGLDPKVDSVLNLVFFSFKNQFIRDNESYKSFSDKQSAKGKASAEKRKENKVKSTEPTEPNHGQPRLNNSTYSDSVSDSVKDNKNVKEEDKVVFKFNSIDFISNWGRWKKYKLTQHKFKYKSVDTEQTSLNTLIQMGVSEANCIKIINNSIANGWKGFVALKEEDKIISTNSAPRLATLEDFNKPIK